MQPSRSVPVVFAALVTMFLGCKSGDGAQPAAQPPVAPSTGPSSSQKIASDVAAGKLDRDTANLYLLYALYDRADLPAEYLGNDAEAEPPHGSAVFAEIASRWGVMSAELRAKMLPFRKRPTDPSSIWAKAGVAASTVGTASMLETKGGAPPPQYAWNEVPDPKGHAHFFYPVPQGSSATEKLVGALDAANAWDTMGAALHGHEPCSDDVLVDFPEVGKGDIGPDGKLDVYVARGLVQWPRPGSTPLGETAIAHFDMFSFASGCPNPGFVLIDADRFSARAGDGPSTVVHEIFHAFQGSYPGNPDDASRWLQEATAVWSEDLVFPTVDREQAYLRVGTYMSPWTHAPTGQIDDYVYPKDQTTTAIASQYGAYLFFFYLTREKGYSPRMIGDIWSAIEPGRTTALQAVAKVVPEYPKLFDELIQWNVNRDELRKHLDHGEFFSLDRLGIENLADRTKTLSLGGKAEDTMDGSLAHGMADYLRYTIDRSVPVGKVKIDLSALAANRSVHLHALVRTPGAAPNGKIIDLTDLPEKVFCSDRPDENVESLLFFFTNVGTGADADAPVVDVPIRLDATPCSDDKAKFSYEASTSHRIVSAADPAPATWTGGYDYHVKLDSVWDVTFVSKDADSVVYQFSSTNAWTVSGGGSDVYSYDSASGGFSFHHLTKANESIALGAVEVSHNPPQAGEYWAPGSGKGLEGTITISKDGTYTIDWTPTPLVLAQTWSLHDEATCTSGTASMSIDDQTWDPKLPGVHEESVSCDGTKSATDDVTPRTIVQMTSVGADFPTYGKLVGGAIDTTVSASLPNDCLDRDLQFATDIGTEVGPTAGPYTKTVGTVECAGTYSVHVQFTPPILP
jgi:hypothetical protein